MNEQESLTTDMVYIEFPVVRSLAINNTKSTIGKILSTYYTQGY